MIKDEISLYRILMAQSRDGIVLLDQNGKVYESNKRFADMLGYSLEEIHQLHVWDWDTQFTKKQLIEMIRAIDDHPGAASKIEFTTDDIARAKLLMGKYDPRNLREREISRLNIGNREVNILLSYMIDHFRRSNPIFPGVNCIASQVNIMAETAELLFTVGLPLTSIALRSARYLIVFLLLLVRHKGAAPKRFN